MSRTGYRADLYDELMGKVRQQHEQWEEADRVDAGGGDAFDPARNKQKAGPAHRRNDTLLKNAWDHNLHAANYAPLEGTMFGRNGKMRYRVLNSDDSGHFGLGKQPHTPTTQQHPTNIHQPSLELPGWMSRDVTLNAAYKALDSARKAAISPLRRGAVAAMKGRVTAQENAESLSAEQDAPLQFATDGYDPATATSEDKKRSDKYQPPEEPVIKRLSAEPTAPGFSYDDHESAFWAYAGGAEVISGTGKDFDNPDVTKTMLFGRPRHIG